LQDELTGWRAALLLSSKNTPKPLLANALIALRHAPEWEGVLAYDEFALVTMQLKPPPWLKHEDNCTPKQWTDRDDALTADWLQHQGIGLTVNVAATAAETVAKDHSFHPIRDYLESLEWDGKERIANFASAYLGAEARHRAFVHTVVFRRSGRTRHQGRRHAGADRRPDPRRRSGQGQVHRNTQPTACVPMRRFGSLMLGALST
jgi:hypothetical protein